MNLVYEGRINYTASINKSIFADLLKMTPMTTKVPDAKLNSILNINVDKITIDLKILVGKLK